MRMRICKCWGSVVDGRDMWQPDRKQRVDWILVVICLSLVVWLFKSMV